MFCHVTYSAFCTSAGLVTLHPSTIFPEGLSIDI